MSPTLEYLLAIAVLAGSLILAVWSARRTPLADRTLAELARCHEERSKVVRQLDEMRVQMEALQAELAALRRTIVALASDRARPTPPRQNLALEGQRLALLRQELEAAKTNLARWELERTQFGPDVYRDNQIEVTQARLREIERDLDEVSDP